MINAVLKFYPLYDRILCAQTINDTLRGLTARRPWSGLVKYAILPVPAQVTLGTVDVTKDSNVVTGTGTTWPFTDTLNTTLSATTVQTGIIDATPVLMTNIIPGRYLTIDGGNSGEEAVFVISIDATAGTFRANFTKVHNSGVTITAGSYAGRQFRINSNTPFVTAVGFTSATRMLIDIGWPYSTLAAQSYEITMVFASLGQNVKELLTMVNPDRQYQFRTNVQTAELDAEDPRRAVSQMPYKLAFHGPDPGGAPLYEMWPRPTSVAAYPYYYVQAWTPMSEDNDILPNGIRSDIMVKIARAEAARWPGHKKLDGGIYYDPRVAEGLMREADTDVQYMKLEDDSTAIMQAIYQYRKWPYGGPGPDYYQTDYESYFV